MRLSARKDGTRHAEVYEPLPCTADELGVRRVLKPSGKFAIMVEVVDGDSMWTNVVEGMTAYSPEELKTMLDDAGFIQTEIHRMKPSNATIIGLKA